MSLRRWSWLALVLALIFFGVSWTGGDAEPDWLRMNGHDWRRMDSNARQAYVEGFLAGAALGQAAEGARDTAGVRAGLELLERGGRLRFPFGANVYGSRVSDYYWWKNHLPLPTWYAFLEVNSTLGRPVADSVP
jgi:hypothetical protein